MSTIRTTKQVKLDTVQPHPENYNHGDAGAISISLKHLGQYRAIVVSEATGNILAGNHTYLAAQMNGDTTMLAHMIPNLTPEEEIRIMVADNQYARLAYTDDALLSDLLKDLAQSPDGLVATGWDGDDLDELIADLEREGFGDDATDRLKGSKWLSTIDIYYTAGTIGGMGKLARHQLVHCCMAVKAGWGYGFHSSSGSCLGGQWKPHKPDFIDNEFKDYDHEHHVSVIDEWKPKYATVRDIMSEKQCDQAGIKYYSVKDIIAMAYEVQAAGAENVIVIPKIDVMDQIPDEFVLGFSVPTSYGGTPLPVDRFKGRRVHLLGGSPKAQITYTEQLDGAVVSIDNNYILLQAGFGGFWTPDGNGDLKGLALKPDAVSNPLYIALAMSLGHMARYFQRPDVVEVHPTADPVRTGGDPDADA